MNKAFLALGSNLKNPIDQIKQALRELEELPMMNVINCSQLYQNPPVGIRNQPDFINAVIEITTSLSPQELLRAVFEIEKKHERVRKEKNGPRTLDIDILLYENKTINEAQLQIPHPRMKERAFVIIPLIEIAPDLILPCGISLSSLRANLKDHDLKIVSW